jgi:pimeloyl-ACP methyl ester carboxylesterase
MPHPSADDLHAARAWFAAEATPAAFHTGRYRLRFVSAGAGRPVVFVHGLADLPVSFGMVMREMAANGYRVIGYDLPNGLDDDCKLGAYRHPHYADDLVALLDHLNLDAVDVMGSSFGSTVVLDALARYPTRFRRAVLQGGFARRPLVRPERGLSRLARYWPGRMKQLPFRTRVMHKLDGPQFVGCPPEAFQFLLECSGETPIRAAARRGLILDTLDLRPTLPAIRHPVLMIGGDRDGLVSRANEADVEAGLPDVRRVEFRPCGHYPQYTMPKPMADEMLRFYGGPGG